MENKISKVWNKFYEKFEIPKNNYKLKEKILLETFEIDNFCKQVYNKISKYGGPEKGISYLEGRFLDQIVFLEQKNLKPKNKNF